LSFLYVVILFVVLFFGCENCF